MCQLPQSVGRGEPLQLCAVSVLLGQHRLKTRKKEGKKCERAAPRGSRQASRHATPAGAPWLLPDAAHLSHTHPSPLAIHIAVLSGSAVTSDTRYLSADEPTEEWQVSLSDRRGLSVNIGQSNPAVWTSDSTCARACDCDCASAADAAAVRPCLHLNSVAVPACGCAGGAAASDRGRVFRGGPGGPSVHHREVGAGEVGWLVLRIGLAWVVLVCFEREARWRR